MRLLLRSPTNSRPRESIASACGVSNSPGAEPFFPQVLMNLPSLENLTTRELVLPPCPSPTKMSPLGATRTEDGALNVSGPSPGVPGLPSASRTLPSGLNLKTWWPLPSLPWASVTQILPSRSTKRPCGNTNIPPPKLCTSFPEASNLSTGSRFEPAHVLAPQRSATHTLVPSGSIQTPAVEPQVRPCGIFAQFSMERYGLGSELVGAVDCE